MKKYTALLLCLSLAPNFAHAQYDPSKIFTDNFYQNKGDSYRSASGKPGENYWQNAADYTIEASFDTDSRSLDARVNIDYTNNSPHDLDNLWLQLDQNNTAPTSERNKLVNPNAKPDKSKGYHINNLKIDGSEHGAVQYQVKGTRLHIKLEKPVKAGESVKLAIDYDYTLEKKGGGGRSGYMTAEKGQIFEVSYWYPRMCVYDDYYGWNTLPFIGGGEMYLDYGRVDYKLTVPSDQVVVGAGELVNQQRVLNTKTLKRLQKARKSDEKVMIRKAGEVDEPVTKKDGKVTWHFKMDQTRDVAWAMSSAYIWDAAKINLPDNETALAQSVYPKESTQGDYAWKRSTEMLKASVEHFSDKWFKYPYDVATSAAGGVGGMEFPGFVFNGYNSKPYDMYLLASHEIGHTWFPMIVGSDERRNPFMDEGFNTFIDVYAQKEFNDGEFAPKRDGEYAPDGGNPADEIIDVIENCKGGPTLMTPADDMDYKYVHPLAYFKGAFGLVLLREVILGPDTFDYAFRQYIQNWAYKHPRPEDFFRSMENSSGKDLTWFWQGWYHHNWQLDQAITSVEYKDNNPENGAEISVRNNDQMVMPISVEVEESNGETHEFKVPVGIWKKGKDATFNVNTTSKIKRVVIDNDHQLPDTDRSNNVWKD